VDNRAKNGYSTKSFIEDGLWDSILDGLKDGDYVLIQFGHNDEVPEKVGRYTTPDEFRANLAKLVSETRERGATPVLLSPAPRRRFDAEGRVQPSHPLYSGFVREIAEREGVAFIDLDGLGMELLQGLGSEATRRLYNNLEPGEHPNYPDGQKDDTHFGERGAGEMAAIVARELGRQGIALARLLRD
jgi:lysophospholipase L1-like esterase